MNQSVTNYPAAFDRGYRKGLTAIAISGDPNDTANVSEQLRDALQARIATALADYHQIITEMHPHRHEYMANCLGEITAARRWLHRIDTR